MKESLQIHIPTPCGEDWGRMDKNGEGRFCLQCQKTVVDFTGMTDAQVLAYFSTPRSQVCGRFVGDQLNRELKPASVQRNGWSGWRWILASTLVMVKPSEGSEPTKPVVVENQGKDLTALRLADIVAGTPVYTTRTPKVRKKMARFARDTVRAWKPTIAEVNSVRETDITLAPERMPAIIPEQLQQSLTGFAGAVSVVVKIRTSDTNFLQKIVDSVVGWAPLKKEDFVTMYPNPVERGEALHLAWLSAQGRFKLALFNTRGQLVANRDVEIGGVGQVDQLELPSGMAAGIYMLRITGQNGKVDTREVMVR